MQRDKLNQGGDRHAIVVDPVNRMLYEFYQMQQDGRRLAGGAGLDLRPEDEQAAARRLDLGRRRRAADLPGRRALRRTAARHGRARPAGHGASRRGGPTSPRPRTTPARTTDENLPRMGERIRLRQDFDISGFSPEVQAILKGLKKYGMFVADNGIDWAISVAPDPRIPHLHEELRRDQGLGVRGGAGAVRGRLTRRELGPGAIGRLPPASQP